MARLRAALRRRDLLAKRRGHCAGEYGTALRHLVEAGKHVRRFGPLLANRVPKGDVCFREIPDALALPDGGLGCVGPAHVDLIDGPLRHDRWQ